MKRNILFQDGTERILSYHHKSESETLMIGICSIIPDEFHCDNNEHIIRLEFIKLYQQKVCIYTNLVLN